MDAHKSNLGAGIVGAVVGALLGAVAWAVLVSVSNYKIGFAAIGVGALAGVLAGRLGGDHPALPVLAGLIGLLGCVIGDLLIDGHSLAEAVNDAGGNTSTFEVLKDMAKSPTDLGWAVYKEGFEAMDLLFYAFAAYFGFRFAQQFGARHAAAARVGTTPDPAMWAPVAEATPVQAPDEQTSEDDEKR